MKLCEHIQPIYEEEMRNGNDISSVTTPKNTCCYLCVHMNKNLSNRYDFSDIIPNIDRTPTYPVTIEYFCSKCGCRIDSPLDNKSSYSATGQIDPMVLATPKNVYVKDNHFDQGMKPTILTEEQRLEKAFVHRGWMR